MTSKFKREEGDLAIVPLKICCTLRTPVEHSRFSTERVVKNAQGRLTNIEQKEMKVNGHAAVYSHAKVEGSRSLIGGRKRNQEMESLHLHCEKTRSNGHGVTLIEQWRGHRRKRMLPRSPYPPAAV